MAEGVDVKLGEITVPVYPQRWAYLANHVGKAVQAATSRTGELTDATVGDFLFEFVGGGAYDTLCGLIPNLAGRMTREEFMGEQTSPTIPEIRAAFRVACEVNEINDLPGMLGKALGPQTVEFARTAVLERLTGSIDSPISPSTNGGSHSKSSTPKPRTRTVKQDSPSLESTD